MAKKRNPFEMLLDENNRENIIFFDAEGNPMEFEQVALIPLEETKYAILHPVNMGYAKDEVIVYSIGVEGNEYELIEVEDSSLLEEIFHIYEDLWQKRGKR